MKNEAVAVDTRENHVNRVTLERATEKVPEKAETVKKLRKIHKHLHLNLIYIDLHTHSNVYKIWHMT